MLVQMFTWVLHRKLNYNFCGPSFSKVSASNENWTDPPPRKLEILLFFWVFSSRLMKSFTKQPCVPWVNFWCMFGTSLERKSCFTPLSPPLGLRWPHLFFHCWAWLTITTFRSWLSCDHFKEVASSGPHQHQFPPGWFITQHISTF